MMWNHFSRNNVLHQALCIISNPLVNSNCSYSPETPNLCQNWPFSALCALQIWWMTLTNNRASLLWYFKLCKSFQSHQWIQTEVCSPEKLNSAQNQRYLSLVTLKFHGWPWKTIGYLFYATSRFEHHFIAICEFELELQFEKVWILGQNLYLFSPVTLKFDG